MTMAVIVVVLWIRMLIGWIECGDASDLGGDGIMLSTYDVISMLILSC